MGELAAKEGWRELPASAGKEECLFQTTQGPTMVWIVTGAALVFAVMVLLAASAGKPTYYRWKPISFLRDYAHWFAADVSEGSVLIMGHRDRPVVIELVKSPSGNGSTREVKFRTQVSSLESAEQEAVIRGLGTRATNGVVISWDDAVSAEFVETVIRASPAEIGSQAMDLAEAVVTGLGLKMNQRFTFHVLGEVDMQQWRRSNRDSWEGMARSRSVISRWFGRRQLKRLDDEEEGG